MVQMMHLSLSLAMLVMSTLALPTFNISAPTGSIPERHNSIKARIVSAEQLKGRPSRIKNLAEEVEYFEQAEEWFEAAEEEIPYSQFFNPSRNDIEGDHFSDYKLINSEWMRQLVESTPDYKDLQLPTGRIIEYSQTARHNERYRILRALRMMGVEEREVHLLPPEHPLVRLNKLRIDAYCDLDVLVDPGSAAQLIARPQDANEFAALVNELTGLQVAFRETEPRYPPKWRDTCKSPLARWINEQVTEVEDKQPTLSAELLEEEQEQEEQEIEEEEQEIEEEEQEPQKQEQELKKQKPEPKEQKQDAQTQTPKEPEPKGVLGRLRKFFYWVLSWFKGGKDSSNGSHKPSNGS